MLALVPTAPASLLSLVVQHMPHKLRDRNTQCLFLSAVFAVAEAPSGRPIRDSRPRSTAGVEFGGKRRTPQGMDLPPMLCHCVTLSVLPVIYSMPPAGRCGGAPPHAGCGDPMGGHCRCAHRCVIHKENESK
eukprot:1137946-Pelagomonas_calceolata.AAC.3